MLKNKFIRSRYASFCYRASVNLYTWHDFWGLPKKAQKTGTFLFRCCFWPGFSCEKRKLCKEKLVFIRKSNRKNVPAVVSQPSHMCDIHVNYREQTGFRWQKAISLVLSIINIRLSEQLYFGAVCVWAILQISYKSNPKSGLFLWIS